MDEPRFLLLLRDRMREKKDAELTEANKKILRQATKIIKMKKEMAKMKKEMEEMKKEIDWFWTDEYGDGCVSKCSCKMCSR